VHIQQLDGGEFVERLPWREPRCVLLELVTERHVHAVGEKAHKDVRLDAVLALMEDRPDGQFACQILECCFDLHQLQVELPQLCRIGGGEVGAQQVAALALAHRRELGAIELEVESVRCLRVCLSGAGGNRSVIRLAARPARACAAPSLVSRVSVARALSLQRLQWCEVAPQALLTHGALLVHTRLALNIHVELTAECDIREQPVDFPARGPKSRLCVRNLAMMGPMRNGH
jgi:hypothetical protein